jgi:hypothetical protein
VTAHELAHAPACPLCGTEGYWLVSPPSEEFLAGIRAGHYRARIVGDAIDHTEPIPAWTCETCGHEWGDANEESGR